MIKPEAVIVLFGPTAVGKTELLTRLISKFPKLEVISADSMQVYRHMDIGTAKPSREIRERIPHHLIDVMEPDRQFSSGEFVRGAEALRREILERGALPVLCGGTAYYLRSFICGLPAAPTSDPDIRRMLKERLRSEGLESLLAELARVDPRTRAAVSEGDSYRVVRALEVYHRCGRPLSAFAPPDRPRPEASFLLIGLQRERRELYRRIDARVESMFKGGLPEEVSALLRMGYGPEDPGMRGIGYKEFFTMRKGCWTLADVREAIQRDSRRYAKRQITFFKLLPGVVWVGADEPERVADLIDGFLAAS